MANDKIKFSTGTVVDSSGNLYQAGTQITSTAAEINYATNPDYAVQSLNASGAVTAGMRNLVFAATAVPTATIAATIANAANHAGVFSITQNTTDTVGHTVTIATGTFDGTNSVATLDAYGERLVVAFDTDGAGTIILNSGSVSVS